MVGQGNIVSVLPLLLLLVRGGGNVKETPTTPFSPPSLFRFRERHLLVGHLYLYATAIIQGYCVCRHLKGIRGEGEQTSALVPFYGMKNKCLAKTEAEVLRLCHYLQGLGLIYTPVSKRDVYEKDSVHEDSKVESEEWKERFLALDKLREQLKNASVTSDSINEIIESIELDDVGEWINLAAGTAGAKITGANQGTKNPYRAIDGKKDSFLKSDCKVDQWLIIELSQAAKVKMIEITMKELYSPRLAELHVYGRMTGVSKDLMDYPNKFISPKWRLLTELTPENRKGTQHFTVISSEWVKFIGIRMMKYHGTGTTCAINDISIYGLSPVNNLESLLEEAAVTDGTATGADLDGAGFIQSAPGTETRSTTPTVQDTPTVDPSPSWTPLMNTDGSQSEVGQSEMDDRSEEGKKWKNGESGGGLSVSTFRKMHQDVQSLKGSTTVLSQYVDELHVGLMKTIDELWKAQKQTKSDTDTLIAHLTEIQKSIESIETRIEAISTEQRESVSRAQTTMGVMGFCVSSIGFVALHSAFFSRRSAIFVSAVYILCCLNLVLSILNLVTVGSPSFLIRLSKLKLAKLT